MNIKDIVNIIYNMSIDMSYDSAYFKEELEILEKELSAIDGSTLYYVLESIAQRNEDYKDCLAKGE